MHKVILLSLLALSVSAHGADKSHRLAYSKAENVEVFVDHSEAQPWCSATLNLRFAFTGEANIASVERLLPKLGAVAHGIEVADRAPGTAQAGIQLIQRQHQTAPARVALLGVQQRGNGGAVVREDLVDRRLDMLGLDLGIGWQVEILQQRIAHGGTLYGWARQRRNARHLITIAAIATFGDRYRGH